MLNAGLWKKENNGQLKGELHWNEPASFQHSLLNESLDDAEAGRYVLYTSLATPLGHCAIILRTLKGLERVLPVSLVSSVYGQQGWSFKKTDVGTNDTFNSCHFVHELYQKSLNDYSGETSLPLLWDRQKERIVSNSPQEIFSILNKSFNHLFEDEKRDFLPDDLSEAAQLTNDFLMNQLYRDIFATAFATSDELQEKHRCAVFQALTALDEKLSTQTYLLGDQQSLCDWVLFCILVRFDAVFAPLFKCSGKELSDFRYLANYFGDLYQERHIGVTINTAHIKEHYFKSYHDLNPSGDIPEESELNFNYLFNRGGLF